MRPLRIRIPVLLLVLNPGFWAMAQNREELHLPETLQKDAFSRQRGFHVQEHYPSSNFDDWRIDMYEADLTALPDTFRFVLRDASGIERFCFPHRGEKTSGFGPRNLFEDKFHYGTDVKLHEGDTLKAALAGVVRLARTDPNGYGLFVVIAHENGLETLYGHLSKALVRKGDPVWPGQPIGLGGNSGRSTGSHLHFELLLMGERFDPERVLDFATYSLKAPEMVVERSWFEHLKGLRSHSGWRFAPGENRPEPLHEVQPDNDQHAHDHAAH